MDQQTIDRLHRMRMTGFAEELQRQGEQDAEYRQMQFEERVAFLVEQEWLHRENRRLSGRLRAAKLKQAASMEEIDYTHPRGLNRTAARQLARCDWVRQKENVLIIGPTGVGKTYLACALANQACREGHTTLYTRLPRLLSDIEDARAEGTYPKMMRKLSRVGVLVIDDWGLAPLGDRQRRDILEVLEERWDIGSVVVTSQLPVKDWHALMGDATLADAILDRLVHNAHRLELEGESMRKMKKGLRSKTTGK